MSCESPTPNSTNCEITSIDLENLSELPQPALIQSESKPTTAGPNDSELLQSRLGDMNGSNLFNADRVGFDSKLHNPVSESKCRWVEVVLARFKVGCSVLQHAAFFANAISTRLNLR